MKTIKRMDLIDSNLWHYERVKDNVAEIKIKNEGWSYCPKGEWKTNVRDVKKEIKN